VTEQSPDARSQLEGHRTDYLNGKISQADFMAHSERLAPLAAAGLPVSTPTESEAARGELEKLRAQRLDGNITEADYFAGVERLGPKATRGSGDVTYQNPDGSTITMPAYEAAALDEAFSPPKNVGDYRLSDTTDSSEAGEWRAELCTAMHTAGVPRILGELADATVTRLATQFENADQSAIRTHMEGFVSDLRSRWGDATEARIKRIDAVLDTITGPVGELISNNPWLLADVGLFERFDAFAEHRARKRI